MRLARLPFKAVYNFRPVADEAGARPEEHKRSYRVALVLTPLLSLFFPAIPLRQVGLAMIDCVRFGAPKGVLEAKDIRAQATRSPA